MISTHTVYYSYHTWLRLYYRNSWNIAGTVRYSCSLVLFCQHSHTSHLSFGLPFYQSSTVNLSGVKKCPLPRPIYLLLYRQQRFTANPNLTKCCSSPFQPWLDLETQGTILCCTTQALHGQAVLWKNYKDGFSLNQFTVRQTMGNYWIMRLDCEEYRFVTLRGACQQTIPTKFLTCHMLFWPYKLNRLIRFIATPRPDKLLQVHKHGWKLVHNLLCTTDFLFATNAPFVIYDQIVSVKVSSSGPEDTQFLFHRVTDQLPDQYLI